MDIGSTIGRYVVEARLGEGGMGVVYRARHLILGSMHAMKIVRIAHKDAQERLLREAKAQARLSHPHIVSVTDVLSWEGHLVLVMEYVPGAETLHDVALRSRLDIDTIRSLGRDVLLAMDAAHELGLVHRDIKPANILIQRTRGKLVPKIADFGLVRFDHADEGPKLTMTGQVMGTPGYASPEQLRGQATDRRTDVFSLGATLYELSTGEPAFRGDDVMQICNATCRGEYVAPEVLRPDLPDDICEAIARALEVSLDARASSVDELVHIWTGTRSAVPVPQHPSLDALLNAGPGTPAAKHLASCVACRVDLKRYRRDMLVADVAAVPVAIPLAPPGTVAVRPAERATWDETGRDAATRVPDLEQVAGVVDSPGVSRTAVALVLCVLAVVFAWSPWDRAAMGDAPEVAPPVVVAEEPLVPTPRVTPVDALPAADPAPTPEVATPTPVVATPTPAPVSARATPRPAATPPVAEAVTPHPWAAPPADEVAKEPSDPVTYEVSFGSIPFGATVELDGEVLGPTPRRHVAISAGAHRLRMTFDGSSSVKDIVVEDGEPRRYIWDTRADTWRISFD